MRYRDRFDLNVDLVGLAIANAAAGCSSTFVVNGSPTKTAMVDAAGGRSQISHLTAATMVLLVLLFLTRPLSFLPSAVLATIVFLIGLQLIDYRGLVEIYRKTPIEFGVAIAAAATVVFVGVGQGILLALVLSLLQHVRHSYRPNTAVVLHDINDRWRLEEATPGKMIEPGLVMFWFGSDLFYANASRFAEKARQLVDESPTPVRWLVIDASAITDIDFSAGKAFLELQQDLAKKGVVLGITRINRRDYPDFDRLGLAAAIGENHIFASRHECIAAYRSAVGEQQRDD